MFKHYLSYSLALAFHRSCCAMEFPKEIPLELAIRQKNRLLRSSETMIHHFARAVHTQDRKEESRYLAVALLCLRDCEESFDEAAIAENHEARAQLKTLHGRMEQLVEKAAASEGGQLRMLG